MRDRVDEHFEDGVCIVTMGSVWFQFARTDGADEFRHFGIGLL